MVGMDVKDVVSEEGISKVEEGELKAIDGLEGKENPAFNASKDRSSKQEEIEEEGLDRKMDAVCKRVERRRRIKWQICLEISTEGITSKR